MLDESFAVLLPNADDFGLAKRYLGQFETGLRAGDALHLGRRQQSSPPVPPVLSGRDQASPTPPTAISHPLTGANARENTMRPWQFHGCRYRKFRTAGVDTFRNYAEPA